MFKMSFVFGHCVLIVSKLNVMLYPVVILGIFIYYILFIVILLFLYYHFIIFSCWAQGPKAQQLKAQYPSPILTHFTGYKSSPKWGPLCRPTARSRPSSNSQQAHHYWPAFPSRIGPVPKPRPARGMARPTRPAPSLLLPRVAPACTH